MMGISKNIHANTIETCTKLVTSSVFVENVVEIIDTVIVSFVLLYTHSLEKQIMAGCLLPYPSIDTIYRYV